MNFSFKKFLLIYVACLAMLLVSNAFAKYEGSDAPLEVHYLDIGQGDATLIQYLGQYQILIDGGPSGGKLLNELGKAMHPADKQIELVILTHPDQDHLTGLIDVLDNYDINLFLDNGQKASTDIYNELDEQLNAKKIKREIIAEGSQISIGKYLEFHAYNPDEISEGDKDRNDQSVVLRMDFGENSFLFTGDAGFGAEKDMISDEEAIDVDWLKVGHHGSKSSTSEDFLEHATPQYAIISTDKANRYGHPHEEVLNRLSDNNAKILRTDQQGTVTVECRYTEKECEIVQ